MTLASNIKIKSKDELKILREGGKILSAIIQELKRSLKSGMTTQDIDRQAEQLMARHKVKSAFKGYRGFPKTICVSINEEVVHGIPGARRIQDGDLVSLDAGIIFNGYFSDTAVTVGVGKISKDLQKLLQVAEQSLFVGIGQAKVGNHLSDISAAIQAHVESHNFSVVRDFVGHGIGQALHEEPEVPNFGSPHNGPILSEGMVLAIEPMVNVGSWKTKILDDGWTVVTQDEKPSAHFEHTIAITESGPEILTR